MKVKITYTEQEKQQADKLAKFCMGQLPEKAEQKRSDRHAPYYHIYISDKHSKNKEQKK